MYHVMKDFADAYGSNVRYPRRIGKRFNVLEKAIEFAKRNKGYVMQGLTIVWV